MSNFYGQPWLEVFIVFGQSLYAKYIMTAMNSNNMVSATQLNPTLHQRSLKLSCFFYNFYNCPSFYLNTILKIHSNTILFEFRRYFERVNVKLKRINFVCWFAKYSYNFYTSTLTKVISVETLYLMSLANQWTVFFYNFKLEQQHNKWWQVLVWLIIINFFADISVMT